MAEPPLLMIPGPIEVSPAVLEASAGRPPGHLAPGFMASFGNCLKAMREVWRAGDDAQPFIVAGSGTLAMEMAATNLVDGGERAVVVGTGYFSDRMAEMLRRRGAEVVVVGAPPGEVPSMDEEEKALAAGDTKALFATHVDTSTGVRTDAEKLCELARAAGALSVFDGVCATAGERFEMKAWGADVYLTGSQKAIGLPPGLALLVASPAALEAREGLKAAPPLSLDSDSWRPIMQAYEAGKPAYFATPATSLVLGLEVGLREILDVGVEAYAQRHADAAARMRAAFRALGCGFVPVSDDIAANTLSAVRPPAGVAPGDVVAGAKERGVVIAGGLHPDIKGEYFRVGHMGHTLTRPTDLERTVRAIGEAIAATGADVDVDAAAAALGAS